LVTADDYTASVSAGFTAAVQRFRAIYSNSTTGEELLKRALANLRKK
jgi:hypothetical protein